MTQDYTRIQPQQPEADSGHNYPMPAPHAASDQQFNLGLIGPATLSVAASQIAVEKATDADTRQFANFELREALAVVTILERLNIPASAPSGGGADLLEQLKTMPQGADFDKTYIAAELANHEFLRDLAESYLKKSPQDVGASEMPGYNLAALAVTAFKEHIVLSKNIVHALGA